MAIKNLFLAIFDPYLSIVLTFSIAAYKRKKYVPSSHGYPDYCLSAVECYHCDVAVSDFTDCNTTKACAQSQVISMVHVKMK